MTILFTGRGTGGSFAIRGEQLGRAVGAVVQPNALDVGGYSLAVIIKRPGDVLARLQAMQVPIVYDVVDAWPQPAGNDWSAQECKAWLAQQVEKIKPVGIVAATQRMAQDCGQMSPHPPKLASCRYTHQSRLDAATTPRAEVFNVPILALPHHARPGLALNPIRETIRTVGYEGGEHYLGRWRKFLELECSKRGWRFVVNPASLSDVDIVVAVRDQTGYAPRHWKSNVKLANAQGSGTPVILSPESGYKETACGAELWAETQADMKLALDQLEGYAERVERSEQLLKASITIDSVAATYKAWLKTFLS